MCGIAGIVRIEQGPVGDLAAIVAAMTATLVHRGPDDAGAWVDHEAGVALGSRRLAVIDLSSEGSQPMVSADGHLVLAFNGEVYNAGEMRTDLENGGTRFRGHSDTEVLLEAVNAWGLQAALGRANAMFALAMWDKTNQVLTLARDRLGEKPLYWSSTGGSFLFGSELNALCSSRGLRPSIDRDSVAAYLRHGCVPAPRSIYQGVAKLAAGSLLQVHSDPAGGRRQVAEPVQWWSARAVATTAIANRKPIAPGDAVAQVHDLLVDSVALRTVADVAVGAFLSGGIDSTTVVALMAAGRTSPVRTFTIGSTEAAYDESDPARAVARHLGTDHTELLVTPAEAMAAIGRLPHVYDEPFGNSSGLPTLLVSELARTQVTVALSGDGGDELFGGYTRHVSLPALWRRIDRLPARSRGALAAGLSALSPAAWDRLASTVAPVLPSRSRQSHPGDKVHKLARVLGAADPAAAYLALLSDWPDPGRLVLGGSEPLSASVEPGLWSGPGDLTDHLMLADTVGYLAENQLTKLDRASMSVGLEARTPMLDHRLFELAWQLPPDLRIRNGQGKWALRQVLARYIPPELTDRPKNGFAVPIAEWLRGPLRPWAEDLLATEALQHHNLLDPAPIRAAWAEHASGRVDRSVILWNVLMLQSWLDTHHPGT